MNCDTEHPHQEAATGSDAAGGGKAKSRTVLLLLLALVAMASGAIRFAGIHRHYPYMNYVDEGHIIRHAQNMYHGKTLDPHWYQYTAGMMHLTNLGVWSYVQFTGQQEGFRESVKVYPYVNFFAQQYPAAIERNYNVIDPPIFLYIGRLIVVFCGTVSVLVFFAFSKQVLPAAVALAASFLFGVIPGIIHHNYGVNNDIPMLLLFTGIVWMLLAFSRHPAWWRIVLAGLCAGAASSFKMSGILYAGLPLLFCWAYPIPFRKRLGYTLLLAGSCIAGAYLLNPGLRGTEIQVYKTLLWDMEFYATHAATPTALDVALRPNVLGATVLILGGLGLVGACFDREQRRFSLLCLIWLIPFLFLFLRHDYQPLRNLYPLMPLVIFFGAWGVWRGAARLVPISSRQVIVLTVLILLALGGMQADRCLKGLRAWHAKPNSRVLVANWLEAHALPGATVAVPDGIGLSPWVMRRIAEEKGIAFGRIENLAYPALYLTTDYVILPRALKGKSADQQAQLDAVTAQLKASGKEVVYTSPGKGGVDLYWGYYHYPPLPLDIWSHNFQQ